jgi:4-alpha-glucanotransferase
MPSHFDADPRARLAERLGIIPEYTDLTGQRRHTSEATRGAILRAMGFEADTDAAAEAVDAELDSCERDRLLQPVAVRTSDANEPHVISVRLLDAPGADARWTATVTLENGETVRREGRDAVEGSGTLRLDLGPLSAEGYHQLSLSIGAGGRERAAEQSLIVVPDRCRTVERAFGIFANLYTVPSERDWGIGDLTTLATLLELTARLGGHFVGINPLHALRNRGWDVSPYSPVSRLFRNPIYLDPAAVPSAGDPELRSPLDSAGVREQRERLRASPKVEYEEVMALKRRLLEPMHHPLLGADEVRRYFESCGEALERFATFEALAEHFAEPDWHLWPEPYRDPRSTEVAEFRQHQAARVDFHRWLQYELDRQLGAAAARGRAAGLRLGLYQDLAIGTSAAGADVWANPHLFLTGVAIGAPPDDYAVAGQNWGLTPMDPRALREHGYRFWIDLVRASLRHAGALRIDHVMGLFRQFWIPDGAGGADGAYVRFPSDDLVGILVLEANRHDAVVVGEDLGTVPPEVPEAMRERGLLSSRIFYFARDGQDFLPAGRYEPEALTTANSHDLPPIAGFWAGRDIELRRDCGELDEAAVARTAVERTATRRAILERLAADGILQGEPATTDELREAVHEFLRRTPSRLVGFNLDDLAGERDPVNLPGVSPDRYPSWTRKLGTTVEALALSRDSRSLAYAPSSEQ